MAEASRMLVVGADPERSRDVVQRLHALCIGSDSSADQVKAAPEVQPLAFSTKYYTANVDVHVHQVLENEPVTPLVHDEYEAVVCVIDVAREESFLHVARFLAQMGSETIDVCLLVGHNSAAEKTSAVVQHLARVHEWCLDNEFEFVELVEDAGASTNQLESESSGFDEKQGMNRVLETLHCNLWRSMVMKSAEAGDASDDSSLRELSQVSTTLSTSNQEEEQRDPKASPVVAPDATSGPKDTAEQDEEGGDQLHTLLRALEITEAADKVDLGFAAGAQSNKNFGDDDIDMAEFSALLSEVRRVRDNGQTMTDEQRRQRAAEVAMKLWNFLGADDESDDDKA